MHEDAAKENTPIKGAGHDTTKSKHNQGTTTSKEDVISAQTSHADVQSQTECEGDKQPSKTSAETRSDIDEEIAPLQTETNGVSPVKTDISPTSDERFATPVSSRSRAATATSPIAKDVVEQLASSPTQAHRHKASVSAPFSQFSHQQLARQEEEIEPVVQNDEGEWQAMPALATYRVYDDWGKVLAKSYDEVVDDEPYGYNDLGGAGKGYTKVHIDDDALSQTSFDDNTAYLFQDGYSRNALDEEDEARDMIAQMQTTKQLLTEGQRIAYVGIVRLSMIKMLDTQDSIERSRSVKKAIDFASESMRLWSQKMMVRIYSHMDIDSQEQVMVEQLAEHGVLPEDLTPALMQNARVKNPKPAGETVLAEVADGVASPSHTRSQSQESIKKEADVSVEQETVATTTCTNDEQPASEDASSSDNTAANIDKADLQTSDNDATGKAETSSASESPPVDDESPPSYERTKGDGLRVERPEDLPDTKNIDLDIRWTVLCDLFLLLIADGTYDARSRILLEKVGLSLSIEWQEICRFEKRVTDALEMQEQSDTETWNQEENLEARRKAAMKKRLVVMGLCTVGGGLVIGLSAGLLAPVIGAGLAAGFTSIGVTGTTSFLGGAGAAALIGTTGAGIGGRIGLNASNRRTGAVKTFEYRPLHNNKRVNLIITVSGWMAGGVDDVRLPFSTVDPVMGDIYSVLWEPEMLQSTGQTIQILATEALTQTIQQILGATALSTLMAGLAAPIVLTKLAYLIDNPWTVSLARADAAGLILADSLVDRNLGARPITLVGFSLGARLIFAALKELSRRGAIGIIQNVYLFGSPIVTRKDEWLRAKAIVSGRLVNGYAGHDWVLGYLFRATSGGLRSIAGLSKVPVPGVENIDLSEIVPGHMAYRGMMPILLREVGWEVDSLEFTEIDDPDPDNHDKRQRELISDIEEARRQLEVKDEKKGFLARFTRKKATAKKAWETYDEKAMSIDTTKDAETIVNENANVLFDVEAIRREALELAKQGEPVDEITKHMTIREIQSTLPPMKISSTSLSPSTALSPSSDAGHSSFESTRPRSQDEPKRSHSSTHGVSKGGMISTRGALPRASSDIGSVAQSQSGSEKSSFQVERTTSADVTPTPALTNHTVAPSSSGSPVAESEPPKVPVKKVEADEPDFGQEKEIEMSFE